VVRGIKPLKILFIIGIYKVMFLGASPYIHCWTVQFFSSG